jgi:SAM-dependent methyltransferase
MQRHMSDEDFPEFLHGLRTEELKRLPPGARVVLSGGANSRWYFDWFADNYDGSPDRHIGVEALAPKPDDLPDNAEWVASTLGDLSAVESGSVDLVFAGEVIEHLWADDIAGFLLESHRVLAPGGRIALDSPNRRVTQAIAWLHPEHTLEFTVDEIAELLELAGFDDVELRGVLRCYDRRRHRFLPIEPIEGAGLSRAERIETAADDPEDAFVWWAHGRRGDRAPDAEAVRGRVRDLFARYRPWRVQQLNVAAGVIEEVPYMGRVVRSAAGTQGVVTHGPYVCMPPGEWSVGIDVALAADAGTVPGDQVVAAVDVVAGGATIPLGETLVRASELAREPGWSTHRARFSLPQTTMGVEFRLRAEGGPPLITRLAVDLRPAEHVPPPAAATPPETLQLALRKVRGVAGRARALARERITKRA